MRPSKSIENVRNGWKADIDDEDALATPDDMLRTIILAAGSIALAGCSEGCAKTLISRAEAPDRMHSAVMFQRDCGATSGFSTQISVVEYGEEPPSSGNTFRADDDHGAAAAGEWGGPWAAITWLAPDHLLIRYATKSRLFEQDRQVSGVRISYQQVNR
jgi:hypothetical protein